MQREERRKRAPHVLRLLLDARTTEQRAAAWAEFKEVYGSWTEALSGPGAAARIAELLPSGIRRELLQRHVEESRNPAPDDEYMYRIILSSLAEHIDGPVDAIRDLLDDMLRNGPPGLRDQAATILLKVGDEAWQFWPAIREVLAVPARASLYVESSTEPLAQVVTRCVLYRPDRLDAVEEATWDSFAPGLVAVLRDLGPRAVRTRPLLALILGDPSLDATARWRALEALDAMSAWDPDVIAAILAAIDDPSDDVAERAMAMAARRRLDPRRFLPALLERVDDTSWNHDGRKPGDAARAALQEYGVEPPPPPPARSPPGSEVEPHPAQAARDRARSQRTQKRMEDILRGMEKAAEELGRKRGGPRGISRKR